MSTWIIPYDQLNMEQSTFLFEILNNDKNYWVETIDNHDRFMLIMHSIAIIQKKEPSSKILLIYFKEHQKKLYLFGINELKISKETTTVISHIEFSNFLERYDYIFCDDIQNLSEKTLKKIAYLANRFIVFSTPYQSPYAYSPFTLAPTLNIDRVSSLIPCAKYTLYTTHSVTKSTTEILNLLHPNLNLLNMKESLLKEDTSYRTGRFSSIADEINYLRKRSSDSIKIAHSTAILLPSQECIPAFITSLCSITNYRELFNHCETLCIDIINYHLSKIGMIYLTDSLMANEYLKKNITVIMTYENIIGLRFDEIMLPFLDHKADIKNKIVFLETILTGKYMCTFSFSSQMHKYLQRIESL